MRPQVQSIGKSESQSSGLDTTGDQKSRYPELAAYDGANGEWALVIYPLIDRMGFILLGGFLLSGIGHSESPHYVGEARR